jgi:gamma-glutamyl:cysteine ligase YbdK (ATP-grasp superfamily)
MNDTSKPSSPSAATPSGALREPSIHEEFSGSGDRAEAQPADPEGAQTSWGLFEALGVEVEYMLVDRESLDIRPVADRVLAAAAGELVAEVERGVLAWSNELVLHVLELKTNGPIADPARHLAGLRSSWAENVQEADRLAAVEGCMLLPTAMHPWMNPARETVLWPHEYSPVYEAYDRIFSCQGHGWSNLQSMHLNLPFSNDEEFGRLHAAIRLLLPLLPALAASSPIADGKPAGFSDYRMEVYRHNSSRIPLVAGSIVPEPVFDQADYNRQIFAPMYEAIAPHDPEGVLRDEFLNSRGAIARFSRGSIEIRVIDSQECPQADLAIAAATLAALELLVAERWTRTAEQRTVPTEPLADLLRATTRRAEQTLIESPEYLRHFGLRTAVSAGELWRHLVSAGLDESLIHARAFEAPLDHLTTAGTLSSRILRRTGSRPDRARLHEIYDELACCLREDRLFP